MNILKTIGSVFVKIWRWIKNTAWVQPLLIVGTIFGVIFAIPSISNGIQSLINGANSADAFYHNFQKSMEGDKNSAADKFLNNYKEKEEQEEEYTLPTDEQKYFLLFTSANNSSTKDIKEGFEALRDNWGGDFAPTVSSESFKLFTIYTDEETSTTTPNESAFSKFLNRHLSFFEKASEVGLNYSAYTLNGKVSKDDLENLACPDPSNFKVPTLMLVDWNNREEIYEGEPNQNGGIKQVFFDVPGDNSVAKAKLLYQCWNNKGDFSHRTDD